VLVFFFLLVACLKIFQNPTSHHVPNHLLHGRTVLQRLGDQLAGAGHQPKDRRRREEKERKKERETSDLGVLESENEGARGRESEREGESERKPSDWFPVLLDSRVMSEPWWWWAASRQTKQRGPASPSHVYFPPYFISPLLFI
jgi:hypothetical protein